MAPTAASGTSTYRSAATSLKSLRDCSYHLLWTGTVTGTWQVWVSNVITPTIADETDWVLLTLAGPIAQPAGAAGKEVVDLAMLPFGWVKAVYVNASGTGNVSAMLTGKGF